MTQLIAQKLLEAPAPLSSLRSDIGAELEKSIMKALAKDPANRPATASEWFETFDTAASAQEKRSSAVNRAWSSWRLRGPRFMSTMNVMAASVDPDG